MHRALALLLSLAFGSSPLLGQSPQKETVLIKAGCLVDVRSGRAATDQIIVIEGGRIRQVSPAASVQAPVAVRVIDLSNATVLPGLIDCHTHLTGEPGHNGYEALGI